MKLIKVKEAFTIAPKAEVSIAVRALKRRLGYDKICVNARKKITSGRMCGALFGKAGLDNGR